MPGTTRAGGIRPVLSTPAVPRTFALALVGRLAYGLLPLCLLFTLRDASGSFAVAASATAALGLATLAMPLQSRLVDRFGQRRVLPCYAACHVVLLLTTAVLSRATPADVVWVGLCVLLGLAAPALGPAMRAQWREIAEEGAPRRVAYSLDSIGEESLYLVGPLLASVVLALTAPRAGLVVAAVLIAVGTAGLVSSPYVPPRATPPPPPERAARSARARVLAAPGFPTLALALLLAGAGASAALLGVAALADAAGTPSAVGLVEAATAAGAVLAGLGWTRLRREPPRAAALGALLLVVALAQLTAAAAAPHLLVVGVLFAVAGAAGAPALVVAFTAADGLVEAARRTEASTWVTTSLNAGGATGTALAGFVSALDGAAPFVVSAALSAAAAGLVLARPRGPRSA